jgi:hypothetical protein
VPLQPLSSNPSFPEESVRSFRQISEDIAEPTRHRGFRTASRLLGPAETIAKKSFQRRAFLQTHMGIVSSGYPAKWDQPISTQRFVKSNGASR